MNKKILTLITSRNAEKVNVIPVISKSDAFTTEEVVRMKQRV